MGTHTFHAHTTQVTGLFITNSLIILKIMDLFILKRLSIESSSSSWVKFEIQVQMFLKVSPLNKIGVGFQVLRTLVTQKLNSLSFPGIIIRFLFLKTLLNIAYMYFALSTHYSVYQLFQAAWPAIIILTKLLPLYRKLPSTLYLKNRGTCIPFTHYLSERQLSFQEIVNTSHSEQELFLEQCLFINDDSGTNLF